MPLPNRRERCGQVDAFAGWFDVVFECDRHRCTKGDDQRAGAPKRARVEPRRSACPACVVLSTAPDADPVNAARHPARLQSTPLELRIRRSTRAQTHWCQAVFPLPASFKGEPDVDRERRDREIALSAQLSREMWCRATVPLRPTQRTHGAQLTCTVDRAIRGRSGDVLCQADGYQPRVAVLPHRGSCRQRAPDLQIHSSLEPA
jgi:hypothetical protein